MHSRSIIRPVFPVVQLRGSGSGATRRRLHHFYGCSRARHPPILRAFVTINLRGDIHVLRWLKGIFTVLNLLIQQRRGYASRARIYIFLCVCFRTINLFKLFMIISNVVGAKSIIFSRNIVDRFCLIQG